MFLRAVFGWYRKRARAVGVATSRCGAVTVVQSFGSALNLNVHFHALVLDGVYAWDQRADGPVFHPVRGLTTEEVEELVEVVRYRVLRLLERRGLLEDANLDQDNGDGQVLMQAASAAGRVAMGRLAGRRARCLRGLPGSPYRRPKRCAQSGWFNLHANVRIAGRDREGLQRLCRYVARPPLAHGRLE
ncbi:MAG: transposase, partial [Deltaproteobacteria bacterium]|nr:transposase [Deltaproteobacteria bacterium]